MFLIDIDKLLLNNAYASAYFEIVTISVYKLVNFKVLFGAMELILSE